MKFSVKKLVEVTLSVIGILLFVVTKMDLIPQPPVDLLQTLKYGLWLCIFNMIVDIYFLQKKKCAEVDDRTAIHIETQQLCVELGLSNIALLLIMLLL